MSLNGILRPWSPEMVSSLVQEVNWIVRVFFSLQHVYILVVIVEGWALLFSYTLFVYLTSNDTVIFLR